MVQHGRRAVYEPAARRVREADADERERVPAQGADVRALLADRARAAGCCGSSAPRYTSQILSHRLLRYALGAAAPRAARDVDRAARPRLDLRRRAGRQAGACSLPRWPASASPATTCSSPGRPSSRSSTTSAAACRPRGKRPRARGEPRRRRGDRRARRSLVVSPVLGGGGSRREARRRGAGALPADARRPGRRRLRAAEAPDDGRRRGVAGRRLRGRPGATRGSRAPGGAPAAPVARRAAPALERRPRRHVGDRAAADAPLPGRPLHRAPAAPARRASRGSPAGRRSTAAQRCRGPSGSSSTSGTSSTARRQST